ncbi:hypothetical protein SYNPS1DRAFT_27377, partial [Syncephalis pseudoplumigaleata]
MSQDRQHRSRLSDDEGTASETEDAPLLDAGYPAPHGDPLNGRHDYGLPQARGETSLPAGNGSDRLRALTARLPDALKYQPESLRRHILKIILGAFLLLVFLYWLFKPAPAPPPDPVTIVTPVISAKAFAEGLAQCRRIRSMPGEAASTHGLLHNRANVPLRRNPHYDARAAHATRVLLHGGIAWDPVDGEQHVDILLEKGVIVELNATLAGMSLEAIRAELGDATPLEIVDVSGRTVTPGIVDMHSHIGLSKWPATEALDDVNEYTEPTLAQVRSLDGFKQSDPAIPAVVSG